MREAMPLARGMRKSVREVLARMGKSVRLVNLGPQPISIEGRRKKCLAH